jgi:H+/Cl- antiporter ClcA
MGSYYQSLSYLAGGKRANKSRKIVGGFYPSIMGGVMKYGSFLMPVAVKHGMKLMNSSSKKSKTSKRSKKSKRKTLRKKIQA